MPSVPIGGLRVDLQLNSAAFIRDIAKSNAAIAGSTRQMSSSLTGLGKTVNTVSQAFVGFLGVRAVRQVINYTEGVIRLAATMKGPLGAAAEQFQDKATALNNSFKLGLAEGFMSALQDGLKQSGLGMEQLAAAGVAAGNILGFTFTTIVNFFTQEIPSGIKQSIGAINSLITSINSVIAQFNDLNQALNNSAVGQLFGFSGTQGNLSTIPIFDTSGINVAIKDWVNMGAVAQATGAALETTAAKQREMNAAAEAFHQLAMDANQAFDESRTPMEKYAETVAKLNALLKEGAISAETYGRLNAMAAANAVSPWLEVANTVAGALGTLFKENKAVAIAQAVINTAQAITKSMAEYGFTPIGIAAMAAAALAGAAQIATILSTEPGSKSAAFKSPKTNAATASAGAAGGGGRTRTQTQVVTLNIEGDIFGPEHFRKIVAGINGVQRDGTALLRIA